MPNGGRETECSGYVICRVGHAVPLMFVTSFDSFTEFKRTCMRWFVIQRHRLSEDIWAARYRVRY